MRNLLGILTISLFSGCIVSGEFYSASIDGQNTVIFGYHPVDPLPVKLVFFPLEDSLDDRSKNERLMNSLPDEIMRLAIGEVGVNGNLIFSTAEVGYAGKSYRVILDYIKFDTKAFGISFEGEEGRIAKLYCKQGESPDVIIPVYVGIGLRLTASVTVHEGRVELGNLLALGAAAEAKKVSGNLIVQTMGISGESISTYIPIPNELNETTIQNAILAIGAIKAKIYEEDTQINPRLIGFYNNVGGDKNTLNSFISNFLNSRMEHIVE